MAVSILSAANNSELNPNIRHNHLADLSTTASQ